MASIEAVGARGIRRLVPDEWATLRQVRLTALADAPDAFSSTLDQELAFDEHRWREWIFSSACFAAWRDGQPTGLACGFDDKAGGWASSARAGASWSGRSAATTGRSSWSASSASERRASRAVRSRPARTARPPFGRARQGGGFPDAYLIRLACGPVLAR
jgi:hypothetical protein